ncbi:MAG: hypothetical protein ACYSX0_11980 [Planctomycetota bacterium]|jgi:hypothetical protein
MTRLAVLPALLVCACTTLQDQVSEYDRILVQRFEIAVAPEEQEHAEKMAGLLQASLVRQIQRSEQFRVVSAEGEPEAKWLVLSGIITRCEVHETEVMHDGSEINSSVTVTMEGAVSLYDGGEGKKVLVDDTISSDPATTWGSGPRNTRNWRHLAENLSQPIVELVGVRLPSNEMWVDGLTVRPAPGSTD